MRPIRQLVLFFRDITCILLLAIIMGRPGLEAVRIGTHRMSTNPDEVEVSSERIIFLSGAEAARLFELYLRADQAACTFIEKNMPMEQFVEILGTVYEDLYKLGSHLVMEIPTGTPSWIDDELLKETVFTLSPRYPNPVSVLRPWK